jgi:hypothetical protein
VVNGRGFNIFRNFLRKNQKVPLNFSDEKFKICFATFYPLEKSQK